MSNFRRPAKRILSREKAVDLFLPYFDDHFVPAIQVGLNKFAEIPPNLRTPLRARTKACLLNDFIADDLRLRLKDEVKVNDDCGFPLFIFGGKAAVRLKKVNKWKMPSNIKTGQQKDIDCQLELEVVEKVTYVTLGYHLDRLWDKALWVAMICRLNGVLQWSIPVTEDSLQAVLFTDRAKRQDRRGARVRAKGHQGREIQG